MINLVNHHTSYNNCKFTPRPYWLIDYKVKQQFVLRPALEKKKLINKIAKPFLDAKKKKNVSNFFKSKELLCWRSDLAFFNMRAYFLNTIRAMHLIWTATKNNERVVFVNHGGPLDDQANLSAVDIMVQSQIQRTIIPRTKLPPLTETNLLQKKRSVLIKTKPIKGEGEFIKNNQRKAKSKTPIFSELGRFLDLIEANKTNLKKHLKIPNTPLNKKKLILPQQKTLSYGFLKYHRQALLQTKIARVSTRLCATSYAGETPATMGFFSNSTITFKTLLNHLEPSIERKTLFQTSLLNKSLQDPKTSVAQGTYNIFRHAHLHLSNIYVGPQDITGVDYDDPIRLSPDSLTALDCFFKPGKKSSFDKTTFQNLVTSAKKGLSANPKPRLSSKNKSLLPSDLKKGDLAQPNLCSTPLFVLKLKFYSRRFYGCLADQKKPQFRKLQFKNSQKLNKLYNKAHYPGLKPAYQPNTWAGANYYDNLMFANNVKNFEKFAKNPLLSQASVIIFSHPEKAKGLVRQAKNLQIPTIGLISGCDLTNPVLHKRGNLIDIVDFPIIGNSENNFFVTMVLQNFLSLIRKVYLNSRLKKDLINRSLPLALDNSLLNKSRFKQPKRSFRWH